MAAGSTYTPIATTTASGSQNTITFSSIPSTYTDLVLVTQTSYSANGVSLGMKINSDGSSSYSYTYLLGDGSSAASGTSGSISTGMAFAYVATAGQIDISIGHIMNYSNTTTYKTAIIRSNNASNRVQANVELWRSTAAINRLDIATNAGDNYAAGSTFTLYGIAAA
jgi:uncharacterized protein YfaP (DUF2135 family)